METLIELQPAYVLHSRPFRDTSLLLDFLTRDYGRVRAIARGVRGPRYKNKFLLQAFVPVRISISGKRELKTLRNLELRSDPCHLAGNHLFAALYLNELLVRLLHGQESDDAFFELYEQTLKSLSGAAGDIEPVLRNFELDLLMLLGYGIEFTQGGVDSDMVREDKLYYFQSDEGFLAVDEALSRENRHYYPGNELHNIAMRDFSSPQTRKIAKRILRQALARHLGDKPLKSRQLFL